SETDKLQGAYETLAQSLSGSAFLAATAVTTGLALYYARRTPATSLESRENAGHVRRAAAITDLLAQARQNAMPDTTSNVHAVAGQNRLLRGVLTAGIASNVAFLGAIATTWLGHYSGMEKLAAVLLQSSIMYYSVETIMSFVNMKSYLTAPAVEDIPLNEDKSKRAGKMLVHFGWGGQNAVEREIELFMRKVYYGNSANKDKVWATLQTNRLNCMFVEINQGLPLLNNFADARADVIKAALAGNYQGREEDADLLSLLVSLGHYPDCPIDQIALQISQKQNLGWSTDPNRSGARYRFLGYFNRNEKMSGGRMIVENTISRICDRQATAED
ncbi:MAG: hypothetical protein WC838_06480, partial [Candidatus Margulisiibacteriota bacterium]